MTQFPDERAAEMLELFFESAQELLQALNEEALKLEKRPAMPNWCAASVASCTPSRAMRRLAVFVN